MQNQLFYFKTAIEKTLNFTDFGISISQLNSISNNYMLLSMERISNIQKYHLSSAEYENIFLNIGEFFDTSSFCNKSYEIIYQKTFRKLFSLKNFDELDFFLFECNCNTCKNISREIVPQIFIETAFSSEGRTNKIRRILKRCKIFIFEKDFSSSIIELYSNKSETKDINFDLVQNVVKIWKEVYWRINTISCSTNCFQCQQQENASQISGNCFVCKKASDNLQLYDGKHTARISDEAANVIQVCGECLEQLSSR